MAVDPDWSDEIPPDTATGKSVMLGYKFAADSVVWDELSLTIDCNALDSGIGFRFCSPFNRTNDVEPRLEYSGFFMVAYEAATTVTHDLWVEYTVDLLTPTAEVPRTQFAESALAGMYQTTIGADSFEEPGLSPNTVGGGLLRFVRNNYDGIPTCVTSEGYTPFLLMKVPPVHAGYIDANISTSKAGVVPSTELAASAKDSLVGRFFNSAGTYLGQALSSYDYVERTTGPNDAVSDVAAGALKHALRIGIDGMLAQFPTVAYIAFHIISDVTRTSVGGWSATSKYAFTY